MENDRLITIAIHTYDRAVQLKNLLESEGVHAVLHNVNLSVPIVSSGVRVRIHEYDLPRALRIIETTEIFKPDNAEVNSDARKMVLVPVDFSDYSLKACEVAFHLANKHNAEIKLLHSFLDPYMASNVQLDDTMEYDNTIEDVVMEQNLVKEARNLMNSFIRKLKNKIKNGELPAVKFTFDILEGLPEEVITEYSKQHNPELIVMGTRGASKKEKELIGSVTAEVLDSCRTTVFTVPESVDPAAIDHIGHAVFFSNLEQEDILALDELYRLFPTETLKVTVLSIPRKKRPKLTGTPVQLLEYGSVHYPRFSFTSAQLTMKNILEDFKMLAEETQIDLIVVPNKKKNVFARLFNPSVAHRLLFHSDIPMVVIPV